MIVLGIETSTKTGGVALVSEQGVIAEYTLNIEVTHSERLMATIDRVFRDAAVPLSAVDGFAVAVGPGSFTGLRIGIASVSGLAFTTGKPVAAVSTLQALAWNVAPTTYPVCPILDARKKEVYAAVYRSENCSLSTIIQPSVLSLQDLAGRISDRTVITGEGSLLFRKDIEKLFGERALFAPLAAVVPSAASVAELGLMALASGRRAGADDLAPLYLRRPEAEVAWEKRQRSR